MKREEVSGAIPMYDSTWTKDGEQGCLTSIVKIGAATVALVATAVLAYSMAIPAIEWLWFGK